MSFEDHLIPNSIFLDDVNIINHCSNPSNDTTLDDNEYEHSSIVNGEMVDELMNYDPATPFDASSREDDDVTLHSTTSLVADDNEKPCHQFDQDQHHHFDRMTCNETASYRIMSLLDAAGAPRICYNRLVALLKKLSKDGFDVRKAINRETLMQRLGRKYKAEPKIQTCIINKQEVFRFKFHDVLQDLLHSSSKHLHQISPFLCPNNLESGTEHELWNTSWMRDTFTTEYRDFDPKTDIMLPIILYMDKTGTDVNQRYSLEPVLFSFAAISREQRESRHSWRHLGFIPQKESSSEDDSISSLQFYHDCLAYILDGLKEAQKTPPKVVIKLPLGNIVERRALLPLMIVMGDQLSQDTLCGRLKSNSGGAGRVHRSCMCSYLNVDDPYHECKKVNTSTLDLLTTYATISEEDMDSKISSHPIFSRNTKEGRVTKSFLQRQRTMFRSILRHPFTTHPIKNAFAGMDFGAWSAGIHDATFDDFMHSVEAGMIAYITETVYDGLTKKEKERVEEVTRPMLDDHRCSVLSTFPRWRLQPGFTRQTLMTSGERVGSILALSLSLQDPTIRETLRKGHSRQIQKYLDLSNEFPADKMKRENDSTGGQAMNKKNCPPPQPPAAPEFYLDQHMHKLDDQSIRHTLEHMFRHGFQVSLIDDLDPFQVNQMIWQCHEIFKATRYPDSYPSEEMVGSYTDLGEHISSIPKDLFHGVKYALQTKPSKLLKTHRHRKVEGTTVKHLMKKPNKKGEGSSAAVLSTSMGTLNIYLEYVLCYHAFCKYSWSLPVFLQRDYENIKAGNRFVVEYFQKLIYRGNHTVDSRFPKIHAQCRMGMNTEAMNSVMNFCCETGERLLKTEAKGISRTAQQRGNATFLSQTMSRLQDRSVLDSFALYLEGKDNTECSGCLNPLDRFARMYPHFVYDVDKSQICSVSRKNEHMSPNKKSGSLPNEVVDALRMHEPQLERFEIHNEVILRDNSRVRASPNYANSGPWYDYVNVSWERSDDGIVETYLLPARCICFFRKEHEEQSGYQEIMALVHTVDSRSVGKIPGRTDTLLTRHYRMQYDSRGQPVTHVIPVASIDSSIRCFSHAPNNNLFNADSPDITYLLPRNHWAYMWMAINKSLLESNSDEKIRRRKGKLISLCSSQWLESVRQRYHKFLNATSHDDL